MGRGRPKWLPPDLERVEAYAARGLTLQEIAHCLGICYDTLNERRKELSDFSEAIKRGQAKGHAIAANIVHDLIVNDKDRSLLMFFLERRCGWVKTVQNEMGGIKDGQPIKQEIKHSDAEPEMKSSLQKIIESVLRK